MNSEHRPESGELQDSPEAVKMITMANESILKYNSKESVSEERRQDKIKVSFIFSSCLVALEGY